ncbi:hypothetical protein MIB92_11110 [Aestuariirhabdus sp. Z084]|uniref:GIY-YIG nuclease family protein n=1 Tax=Aestuariirhabdus haliotis TaxID=2918751 RepID=UPI00201B3664|nr:GIY-YIG nuclease family protein [Aestuariirhabdus haliotis]MCL6416201.1 hypothetical protein [Aestuariirhabdus haliotis]MCL6420253.1 hypothetical protein [Aestuariirhabdus haliotis]
MIVFTVSNRSTGKLYIGTTRNDLTLQWDKIVAAAEEGLDFPLYKEIRLHGADNFQVEEWDYTDDRHELATLEREALTTLGGESLRGYKTAIATKAPVTKPVRRKPITRKAVTSNAKPATTNSSDNKPAPISKPKDTGTLRHVNAGGESVVRFDRKRSSIEDAIAGIGNRRPEQTVVDPLSRSRSSRAQVPSSSPDASTPGSSETIELPAPEPQTPVSETGSGQQTAADDDAINAHQTAQIPPAAEPDISAVKDREQVLADALSVLQQLKETPIAQTEETTEAEAQLTTSSEAVTETDEESAIDEHAQQLNEAIARQRQQLAQRCQQQQKQFSHQQIERIDALEQLAQQKMARLSNAA